METLELLRVLRSSLEAGQLANASTEFIQGLNAGLSIALKSVQFWEDRLCK